MRRLKLRVVTQLAQGPAASSGRTKIIPRSPYAMRLATKIGALNRDFITLSYVAFYI